MHLSLLDKRDGVRPDDFFLRLLPALLRTVPFGALRSDGALGLRVTGTEHTYTVDFVAGSVHRGVDHGLTSILDLRWEVVEGWKAGAASTDVGALVERGDLQYRGYGAALEDLLLCLSHGLSPYRARETVGAAP